MRAPLRLIEPEMAGVSITTRGDAAIACSRDSGAAAAPPAADGTVAFAMQWQGEAGVVTPLLGLHRPGQSPVLAEMPDMLALRLKGYAGSVAFSGDGARVAISCPRGGLLVVFDRDGTLQTTHSRADICGLGSAPDGFFATDGLGGIARVQNGALHMLNAAPRAWDNHLITL